MSAIRRNRILETLKVHGRVSFSQLAEELDVSEETVRRDIKHLISKGVVEPVRGGAALPEVLRVAAFHECLTEQAEEKKIIAKLAAQLVKSGDTIMIGGGSTTAYFSLALRSHMNLTIVTNSVDAARILTTSGGNKVFTVGGKLDERSGSVMGMMAANDFKLFAVEKAFFSVGWLTARNGLMCDTLEEVECWRAMMSCAGKAIALVDSSKFGKRGLFKAAALEEVDILVTDKRPASDVEEALTNAGCDLVCPGRHVSHVTPSAAEAAIA